MGVTYLMADTSRKTYIELGKMGEWSNDLWKIWKFLKISCYSSGCIVFVSDTTPFYKEIKRSGVWEQEYKDSLKEDMMGMFYDAQEIVSGGNIALWQYFYLLEISQMKKNPPAPPSDEKGGC